MTADGADRWERRYRESQATQRPQAAAVLADHVHLLPDSGAAVDLACGRGGNALLLAAHGLQTQAWDYAATALQDLEQRATAERLTIDCQCRDVVESPPAADSFDIIVVSHFLDRTIMPALAGALRAGGLLFYQTFSRTAVSDAGPGNPAYRLADNELLQLLPQLQVVHYHEAGRLGDTSHGFRDRVQYIGWRRP